MQNKYPSSSPHLRSRARRALWFGAKMILRFIWWEVILTRAIGRARVDAGRMQRLIMLARNFRTLALDLGGVWIKLGQFLSSRVDIIPPEVIIELHGLQDSVPPVPANIIKPLIEEQLGKPLGDVFMEFDPIPVAAASFGQAHLALLHEAWSVERELSPNTPRPTLSAKRVIVKVQRPYLDSIVNTDLDALKTILRWLQLYEPIRRRADLGALQKEFAEVIFEELDYELESRHVGEFARQFAHDPMVRVPKTYLATRRVLVLENVEEIKITDYEGLESAGISRQAVARKLFETYLQQIFVTGFFHADPHPGNLFVQPLDDEQAHKLGITPNMISALTAPPPAPTSPMGNSPLGLALPEIPILSGLLRTLTESGAGNVERGALSERSLNAPRSTPTPASSRPASSRPASARPFRLIYIDFGMMGRVLPENMRELKEMIIATSLRDARRMTQAMQRMGFFTPEADTNRIEQAISALFDKVWGMAMNDLTHVEFDEMYTFALQFRDLLSSLPFQVPQNVLYLGRAANILSGMCTALDPRFNPWSALQPFALGIAGQQSAGPATLQDALNEMVRFGRIGVQLPNQADAFFSRALSGQLELRAQLTPNSTNELRRIETSVARLTWAIVLIAVLGCGTVLLTSGFGLLGTLFLLSGLPVLVRLVTL